MEQFTPWSALTGGALIGLSASVLLLTHGRVAGISGIAGGLLSGRNADTMWRVAFVVGLMAAGLGMGMLLPDSVAGPEARTLPVVALGGLVVGFGVRIGGGCTSGHGVCGLSRFSPRSLVATLTFMATGGLTAVAIQLATGGTL